MRTRLAAGLADQVVLGSGFGPQGNCFDPGKMGSYFQDPEDVQQSVAVLSRADLPALDRYIALLLKARDDRVGLYVTF